MTSKAESKSKHLNTLAMHTYLYIKKKLITYHEYNEVLVLHPHVIQLALHEVIS